MIPDCYDFDHDKNGTLTLKTASPKKPLDKLPPILKEDLDKNLCTCNEVPKRDIINAIANGATTVQEVKNETYATMGSGCCILQVERLIECICSPSSGAKKLRKERV